MKRWLKWSAGGLAGLAAGAALLFAIGLQLGERKRERRIELDVRPVAYAGGAAAVERGRYLFASRGCVDCHGADGAGRTFLDDGALVVAGPQIAPGRASATASYVPVDWVRTIRHGVKPDGRPLLIMPSEDYNRLTDADLAALVAYVRQMPAVDGHPGRVEMPAPVRALYGFGMLKDAAEKIDHARAPEAPVPEGVSLEHGRYVANACIGCHGEHLSGGRIPGSPPDWPPAANLTPGPGSAMAHYPDARSFAEMFRSGRRPDGSVPRVMPFVSLSEMSDTDLGALHLYLKSLEPRSTGG